MASMRPLSFLSLLGASQVLSISSCRAPLLFLQQDPAQCFPSYTPGSSDAARSFSTSRPNHSYSYRIGASFSAKGRRFNPKTDFFSFDSALTRVPSKTTLTGRPSSGQDAYFVSRIGDGPNAAFGVADGVGGWADSGIDSADFSHGLCEQIVLSAVNRDSDTKTRSEPGNLLQEAYDQLVADKSIRGGGSTACVAIGKEDGTLEVANLGDSGFLQLRLNAVHYFSEPQTHAFNTPFQLSIIPPKILARTRFFGGMHFQDYPSDATLTKHEVRHGDVLIFATDGVWDNLTPQDILQIVSRNMTAFQAWTTGKGQGMIASSQLRELTEQGSIAKQHENTLQTLLAVGITGEAKLASEDMKKDGPFAKEMRKQYPRENYRGGKVDDICVVVAIVVEIPSITK